jgi:hypothetical protein
MYTKDLDGRTEGKYHFDRLDMNGRVILKWIIYTVWKGTLNSSGSCLGLWVGSSEHGNEPLGSIRVG